MSRILMKITDMVIGYKDNVLYSGVNFEIREGDCIMLCGANGSGKTTLLKEISSSEEAVMIPARIPKVPGFTLKEFVNIGCHRQSDLYGRLSDKDEMKIDQALEKLKIRHLQERDISTLSDGEFQKAAIAIALVRNASIIILDEPTAFLDAENRVSVLQTLRQISLYGNGNGKRPAVIFSTHDIHDGIAAATKVFALGADGMFRQSEDNIQETVKTIFSKTFHIFDVL